jgi:hypothetical protein
MQRKSSFKSNIPIWLPTLSFANMPTGVPIFEDFYCTYIKAHGFNADEALMADLQETELPLLPFQFDMPENVVQLKTISITIFQALSHSFQQVKKLFPKVNTLSFSKNH